MGIIASSAAYVFCSARATSIRAVTPELAHYPKLEFSGDISLCEALESLRSNIKVQVPSAQRLIFEYAYDPEKSLRKVNLHLTNVNGLQVLSALGKDSGIKVSFVGENRVVLSDK
jgi:hypothetical protein